MENLDKNKEADTLRCRLFMIVGLLIKRSHNWEAVVWTLNRHIGEAHAVGCGLEASRNPSALHVVIPSGLSR